MSDIPLSSVQSGGSRGTVSLVHKFAIAGTTGFAIDASPYPIATSSGAMTANTLKSFLNISGVGGEMTWLSIRTTDSTSRTIRTRITIDGVPYDFTSASIATASTGVVLAGANAPATVVYIPPIRWTTSFVMELASSLTETDKFAIEWVYNTES